MNALAEPITPLPRRHRVSVDEYYRMGLEAQRVELIDGEVLEMAAIGSRHAAAVKRLARLLNAALGDRAIVSVQDPLRLSDYDEPQPDIAVVRFRDDFYAGAHPTAADTLLVIEVADSSARYDREIKVPLFARHGIAEAWVVDLDAGLLRIYRRPRGDEYIEIVVTETPGATVVTALSGLTLDLTGLLG